LKKEHLDQDGYKNQEILLAGIKLEHAVLVFNKTAARIRGALAWKVYVAKNGEDCSSLNHDCGQNTRRSHLQGGEDDEVVSTSLNQDDQQNTWCISHLEGGE